MRNILVVLFAALWLTNLFESVNSIKLHGRDHDDHDHDIHDEHSLTSHHQLSKILQDLEAYCLSEKNANESLICESYFNLQKKSQNVSTESEELEHKSASLSTWGYAILAFVINSLVGLLAVAIIPLMHKSMFNHLLQFLVALAIGSMAGDAFLHLIPHAMAPDHHHHHHDHDESEHEEEEDKGPVWFGLMALGGIFLFFVVERIVGMYSEMKRKKQTEEKHQHSDAEANLENNIPKQELENTNKSNHTVIVMDDTKELGTQKSMESASCQDVLMVVHSSKDIKKMAKDVSEEVHKHCKPPTSIDPMVHSHNHHNHSHVVSGSIAAVAWMVIFGDGFHNFADGLALGSAFSCSLQDGLSTAIAIFCHELPHELGDFAMLLNAGMSCKMALVYNCLSSIFCLIGVCIGVGVGDIVAASSWIFMLIAGMFIYIALVDMLPEMKSVDPKKGENPLLHFGLQIMGMLIGGAIMLTIALFEHDIVIPM